MNYKEYIVSPEWKEKAKHIKFIRGNKCQVCGVSGNSISLHVHHNTYKRLGRELETDLVVLCAECHKIYHDKDIEHDRVVTISDSKIYQILNDAGITYTNDDPWGYYSLGKSIINDLADGDYKIYDRYNMINIRIKDAAILNEKRRDFKEIMESEELLESYENEHHVRWALSYWEGWKP